MGWTISRVSSLQLNQFNRQHVARATEALQRAGQELATGVKADLFADLGPRAAIALTLRAREENTQTYITSNQLLDSKLEAMLASVDAVRGQANDVLKNTLVNASRPSTGANALQSQARAALESTIASLNISYNGDHLFSGTASDRAPLTRWEEANANTGLSPQQALLDIVGSGPTTLPEVEAMIDKIDAFFDSSNTADPDRNYEATFFNGTPLLDASGGASNRVSARIDEGQKLVYGVQANDQAFRDTLKGLAMLSVTDVSEIDDEAVYARWMEAVNNALSDGIQGGLQSASAIGFNQQVVAVTQTQLNDMSLVQRTQISNYESVDPYEAATKVSNLETQLQASYSVTARLSQLTLLNYL
ncbi:flagellin [Antarcticimicrobium luteum]|uniref:Flagellin n=1 Tax=Antarcticimicrobium luteum TaxID=2547397 RepID=A0A4R5VDC0_9RHOB|nr:flagellin [Antarcticimicrobium luteum]TDK50210.1 flagellar hook protein [Antarcticimicrobium luteum]